MDLKKNTVSENKIGYVNNLLISHYGKMENNCRLQFHKRVVEGGSQEEDTQQQLCEETQEKCGVTCLVQVFLHLCILLDTFYFYTLIMFLY